VTEDEAKAWLLGQPYVSRETIERLDALRQSVMAESAHQNLISAATVESIWARHIVDSAQLFPLASAAIPGTWLDLGTGAGFPGLVIAILSPRPIVLVESRRKRFEFLTQAAVSLALPHVSVHRGRLETFETRPVSVISARAFAPLPKLLSVAARFSHSDTVWILPKGRGAREELALIASTWHCRFHVEQSLTDATAAIIVASDVSQRKMTR
jgi:16S rRNA (guanine527-N7)-methyltransferase